jgi:hypothetical protein
VSPDLGKPQGRTFREQRTHDVRHVLKFHRLDVYPGEAVQEGLWEAFSTAALCNRVLAREHAERWRAPERLAQFWNENFCPVIQRRVEA